MSDLFRQEAVQFATQRLPGQVVIVTPLSLRTLSLATIAAVAVFAAIACFARYPRVETVKGWVVPERGILRLATNEPGVVESLVVEEGSAVEAGDVIARLRVAANAPPSELRSVQASFENERAASEAETKALRQKLATRRRQLIAQRLGYLGEVEELKAQIRTAEARQQLSEAAASRKEVLLSRGLITRTEIDAERSAALEAAKDASEARRLMLEKREQVRSMEFELAQIPDELAALDAQSIQKLAGTEQRSAAQRRSDTATIVAPVSGKVVAVPAQAGQTLDAGATLALMTPAGSSLLAELYIPSRSAGFVVPGQRVRLRYHAFPYQTYGAGEGTLISISRTVLAPKDVPYGLTGIAEPVFRARVQIRSQNVMAYGRAMPLQPGMSLTAQVTIDRRSLIRWVLDPLFAAGRR